MARHMLTDDERRGCSASFRLVRNENRLELKSVFNDVHQGRLRGKAYIVRARHDQANNKHPANVKDEDPEERPPDRNRDVLPWGLRLPDSHSDELRADVRKERVRQRRPEAEEDRQVVVVHLAVEVRAHRPVRVVPVAEPDAVVPRVPAEVDDDAHEDEADERDDLDAAEPELELAEDAHAEEVHSEDWPTRLARRDTAGGRAY